MVLTVSLTVGTLLVFLAIWTFLFLASCVMMWDGIGGGSTLSGWGVCLFYVLLLIFAPTIGQIVWHISWTAFARVIGIEIVSGIALVSVMYGICMAHEKHERTRPRFCSVEGCEKLAHKVELPLRIVWLCPKHKAERSLGAYGLI